MNTLLVGSLFLLFASGHLAAGSLFGPFGPFGPTAPLPGYGLPPGLFPGAPAGLFPSTRPPLGQLPGYFPGVASPYYPPQMGAFPPVLGRSLMAGGPAPPAPSAVPAPAPVPAPVAGNLRTVAGNSDVLGRLALAELPEDLQQRAEQLQLASEQGFDACEELLQLPGAYWQYKRCTATQLRNVLTAAKALEQEATARAAAAAAAATAEAAAATEPSVAPVA